MRRRRAAPPRRRLHASTDTTWLARDVPSHPQIDQTSYSPQPTRDGAYYAHELWPSGCRGPWLRPAPSICRLRPSTPEPAPLLAFCRGCTKPACSLVLKPQWENNRCPGASRGGWPGQAGGGRGPGRWLRLKRQSPRTATHPHTSSSPVCTVITGPLHSADRAPRPSVVQDPTATNSSHDAAGPPGQGRCRTALQSALRINVGRDMEAWTRSVEPVTFSPHSRHHNDWHASRARRSTCLPRRAVGHRHQLTRLPYRCNRQNQQPTRPTLTPQGPDCHLELPAKAWFGLACGSHLRPHGPCLAAPLIEASPYWFFACAHVGREAAADSAT